MRIKTAGISQSGIDFDQISPMKTEISVSSNSEEEDEAMIQTYQNLSKLDQNTSRMEMTKGFKS
jgi:hypothetical protein